MATSENGYPASSNSGAIGVGPFIVAGVSFPGGVKRGAVTTVLGYVAWEFWRRVEPLRAGTCWGYAYRPISGSNRLSNHASGTAIDCNAPQHPLGARGTFTRAQVAAIRRILAEVGHVVRWGGDYTGRADEMHFEINASPAAVQRIADQIKGGFLMALSQARQDQVAVAADRVLGITRQRFQKDGLEVGRGTPGAEPVTLPDRLDTGHLATRLGELHKKVDALTEAVAALVERLPADPETPPEQ